ncbi:hypothetical protein HDU87_006122 [Geranomyces variabilis]|uniref:Uncharacterized protein n=1 Tax=Geranomyces variabilis TaxID=109894 RepID=A0AAD5TIJ2_9FUNG|nr:hypothetical protein HDU87_006122 [Geranomyces variabilis]
MEDATIDETVAPLLNAGAVLVVVQKIVVGVGTTMTEGAGVVVRTPEVVKYGLLVAGTADEETAVDTTIGELEEGEGASAGVDVGETSVVGTSIVSVGLVSTGRVLNELGPEFETVGVTIGEGVSEGVTLVEADVAAVNDGEGVTD